jgi:heme/copper-type cytochrome/quinol oxidase subunit 2
MRITSLRHYFGATAILAVTLVVGAPTAAAAADTSGATTLNLTAFNWGFKPDTITVKVGQPVTLRLTSTAGVHGLQSDDLGITQTVISPEKYVTVTFTPKKAGTYQVYCSVPCGPGHKTQHLTIVVTP